nr:MAG: hypothetical protein [Microvirus sp.]
MLYLFGIKDNLTEAKVFVDYKFGKELPVLSRDLSHFVNGEINKLHPFALDPTNYDVYRLASIDEESGLVTPDYKFEFNLAALKKHVDK